MTIGDYMALAIAGAFLLSVLGSLGALVFLLVRDERRVSREREKLERKLRGQDE